MFKFAKPQAEERKRFLASACFVFAVFIGFTSPIGAQEEEYPTIKISGIPSFTPNHTLRMAEGEFLLFWGEDREPVHPEMWQSPEPGKIEFNIHSATAAYTFSIASTDTLSASMPVAGVIVHCTAAKVGNQSSATLWCAWRHQPTPNQTYGMAMSASPQKTIEWKSQPDPWNQTLTWRFCSKAFHRDESVVYWVGDVSGWMAEQRVKDSHPPYKPTEKQTVMGWTIFSANPEANKPVSCTVFVPYQPVPATKYAVIAGSNP